MLCNLFFEVIVNAVYIDKTKTTNFESEAMSYGVLVLKEFDYSWIHFMEKRIICGQYKTIR